MGVDWPKLQRLLSKTSPVSQEEEDFRETTNEMSWLAYELVPNARGMGFEASQRLGSQEGRLRGGRGRGRRGSTCNKGSSVVPKPSCRQQP